LCWAGASCWRWSGCRRLSPSRREGGRPQAKTLVWLVRGGLPLAQPSESCSISEALPIGSSPGGEERAQATVFFFFSFFFFFFAGGPISISAAFPTRHPTVSGCGETTPERISPAGDGVVQDADLISRHESSDGFRAADEHRLVDCSNLSERPLAAGPQYARGCEGGRSLVRPKNRPVICVPGIGLLPPANLDPPVGRARTETRAAGKKWGIARDGPSAHRCVGRVSFGS